jgi:hypothetical protein
MTDNLTDVGAAPAPPSWCEPGARPDWQERGGHMVAVWLRVFGPYVWVECEDRTVNRRVLRTLPAIHYAEETGAGIDAVGARRLAAELLNAADIIDPPKSPARGYGRPRHP